jgi:hypothetical protein
MATTDNTAPATATDHHNEALCAVERCQALGVVIQQQFEGDDHAPLFTLLDRELDAIDKYIGANPPQECATPRALQAARDDDAADIPDLLRAAGVPFQGAGDCVRKARALADLIGASEESGQESVEAASLMLYDLLCNAEKNLNSLWVSIGGKSDPVFVRPDGTVDTEVAS